MKTINLLIVGTLPESSGIGGVTIHVRRLMNALYDAKVSGLGFCDYKTVGFSSQVFNIKHARAIHVHVSNPILKLWYVLVSRMFNTTCIITLHGKYGIYGKLKNVIHRLALKLCDVPILINHESYLAVKQFNKKAVYIPAFIKPTKEDEYIPLDFEQNIRDIKNLGRPLFVTNASSRSFTSDNSEIYGIDFLVNYFKSHPHYSLVILDPSGQYAQAYSNNLPDNIYIFDEQVSFCGLVKMADVVIRNTSTDGDSFSVKEALYLHCQVLASDVVSRPKGVFLFRYNDERSFEESIKSIMSSRADVVFEEIDAVEKYVQLYGELGILG